MEKLAFILILALTVWGLDAGVQSSLAADEAFKITNQVTRTQSAVGGKAPSKSVSAPTRTVVSPNRSDAQIMDWLYKEKHEHPFWR